jgi:hypothetical protein
MNNYIIKIYLFEGSSDTETKISMKGVLFYIRHIEEYSKWNVLLKE